VSNLLILSEKDVRELLDIDELLDALADAFVSYSADRASVPPRVAAWTDSGALVAMPVHLPDVALATKLVTVFPGNAEQDRPSHQALIALFEPASGTPVALLDGTYVTAMRTAAAAAVAIRVLARPEASVVAILGAGVQGQAHLEVVPRVRDMREIRVASRSADHAAALAERHPAARPVASFEEAVRGADVVCCCTDAREPIIRAEWLSPGAHVSSVGGTFGTELDPATVNAARVFVEWRGAVTNPPPAGAGDLQELDPDTVTEVGEVLAGTRPGRTSPDELTVYKSTGLAVEDAAAADLVYRRAVQTGTGTTVTI
jgi:alanine dehydrogenase